MISMLNTFYIHAYVIHVILWRNICVHIILYTSVEADICIYILIDVYILRIKIRPRYFCTSFQIKYIPECLEPIHVAMNEIHFKQCYRNNNNYCGFQGQLDACKNNFCFRYRSRVTKPNSNRCVKIYFTYDFHSSLVTFTVS